MFTTAIDVTITNVALPSIATDLSATTGQLQWVVDGYNVVLAGLLLFGGGLADRFGRRRVFLSGYALFGLGSLVAAMAPAVGALIGARVVMGAGAAMVLTPALAILSDLYPPGERGRAIGLWAVSGAVGTALGPVLGGLMIERFWWGSVFLVNVPVVVAGVVLGLRVLPESRRPGARSVDPVGALLSIVGLSTLLFGIIEGPERGWGAAVVVGALVGGVVGLVAFVVWELRVTAPMFDVRVLARPRVATGGAALLVTYLCFTGLMFLVPQYLQFVRSESVIATGLVLVPFAAVFGVVSHWVGAAYVRLGSRSTLTIGLGGLTVGSVVLAVPGGLATVLIGTVICGAGCGFLISPASTVVLDDLPLEKASEGAGVNMVSRFVGAATGVAVVGSIFSVVYSRALGSLPGASGPDAAGAAEHSVQAGLAAAGRLGGAAGAELADQVRSAFDTGMSVAFLAIALAALLAASIGWVVLGRPSSSGGGQP